MISRIRRSNEVDMVFLLLWLAAPYAAAPLSQGAPVQVALTREPTIFVAEFQDVGVPECGGPRSPTCSVAVKARVTRILKDRDGLGLSPREVEVTLVRRARADGEPPFPPQGPAENSDTGPGPFSPANQQVAGQFNPLPLQPMSFIANFNSPLFVGQQYSGPPVQEPYDGSVTNTSWYGDAVLMKQIAGTADQCGNNAQYVSWNNTNPVVTPVWSFVKSSLFDADIVYEFTTCSSLATCVRHTIGPCNK